MMRPITIVGGGLAGLALGIFLRRENIPVAVIEAGRYPRHRVCGEFLSGRGRQILRELGMKGKLPGKVDATTCAFFVGELGPVRFSLREPALCVSRFDLDAALAREFERLGGILKSGARGEGEACEAGVVRAMGRRRAANSAARLFGLKAHARAVELSADLEMHFGAKRYVGLCRLAQGETNVCGLFHSERPWPTIRDEWPNIFTSSMRSDALARANWDEASFCSVAALTLDREAPSEEFAVGDSAAMIPPLTGNGMSMAFESAELAAGFLRQFSAGRFDWGECVEEHRRAWAKLFLRRLRWAAFMQRAMFRPMGQRLFFLGASSFAGLPNLFFAKTR